MMKIYSFDVFDTCLCRTCGEPYAVFELMAKELLGINASKTQIADFRYIREKGETIARKKTYKEDITIEEIYQYCNFSGLTALSNIEIIELEKKIEKRVLKPICRTLNLINEYHKKNIHIIYISDMYLPSSFIKEVLEQHGFWKEGDSIYVSGEIGKTKASGELFRYVSSKVGCHYYQWKHFGDNRHSDVNIPRRMGILAKRLYFGYSYYQQKLLCKDASPSENYISRAVGISRAITLSFGEDIRYKFAADFIAPIYVPFTYNLLSDAVKRGIKKLYFLARDGYLLYKIALSMNNLFPSIEINYLYVSRKSLYLPSLKDLSKDSLKSILLHDSNDIESLYDNFQIDIDWEKYNLDNINDVLENEDFLRLLEHRWHEQKENCLNYFKQERLASKFPDVAIVDVRGTRRCQRSINQILNSAGYCSVFAYYLEADRNRIIPTSKDEYDAVFYGDYLRSKNYIDMSVTSLLFEKYFCISKAKRTSRYICCRGKIVPEFDEGELIPDFYEDIHNINERVCLLYLDYFLDNWVQLYSTDIINCTLSVLSDFMRVPRKEYLFALKNISFSETRHKSTKLIKKIGLNDIIKRNTIWMKGSLMYTSPLLFHIYGWTISAKHKLNTFFR